jgi:hypothetical protein
MWEENRNEDVTSQPGTWPGLYSLGWAKVPWRIVYRKDMREAHAFSLLLYQVPQVKSSRFLPLRLSTVHDKFTDALFQLQAIRKGTPWPDGSTW